MLTTEYHAEAERRARPGQPGPGGPRPARAQRGPALMEEALPVPLLREAGRCGPTAVPSFSPTLPTTLPSFLGILLKPTLGGSLV